MRRLVTALLVATTLAPAGAPAAEFAWPGHGTVRMTVPAGWRVDVKPKYFGESDFGVLAVPATDTVLAHITLLALPPGKRMPMGAGDVRKELEKHVQPYLDGSVEKTFAPEPLPVSRGSGWFVQLTDASLVGKPRAPANSKVMRNAFAALDDRTWMVATIHFDDPACSEVAEAMSLLSSVRLELKEVPAATSTDAFEFTVPESRVKVRVPVVGLRPDEPPDMRRGYFKLSRESPQLIVSGWLEPASAFKGLKAFWETERRSPAYADPFAPSRIELLQVGPWEVVAFDVVVPPGGTSAHLRAERVQAGTWIDLHLSSTSGRAPATLREELVTALRSIEVVEK